MKESGGQDTAKKLHALLDAPRWCQKDLLDSLRGSVKERLRKSIAARDKMHACFQEGGRMPSSASAAAALCREKKGLLSFRAARSMHPQIAAALFLSHRALRREKARGQAVHHPAGRKEVPE